MTRGFKPGPISFDSFPYLRDPFECLTNPRVRFITLMYSVQSGKTMFAHCGLIFFQVGKPSTSMLVMPTKEQARDVALKGRIKPMLLASPNIAKHIHGKRGQFYDNIVQIFPEAPSLFIGSNSPSDAASNDILAMFKDETDKFTVQLDAREANIFKLLADRQVSYPYPKDVETSTPSLEGGRIHTRYNEGSQEKWSVPCPSCNGWQFLEWGDGTPGTGGLKFPKNAAYEEIRVERLAWYECMHCRKKIEYRWRAEMVAAGIYCPANRHVLPSGELNEEPDRRDHRSFHIHALYSPMQGANWHECAAVLKEALDTVDTDPSNMQDCVNSWQGLPWADRRRQLRDAHIRALRDDYYMKDERAPEGALVVTTAFDIQHTMGLLFFWYVVRAWGAGGKSWLLDCGRSKPSKAIWEQVYRIAWTNRYLKHDGTDLTRVPPILDSSDGNVTREVYAAALEIGGVPYKGASRSTGGISFSKQKLDDGDEVELMMADPDMFKATVHRTIRRKLPRIPKNVPEYYYKHLTAEQPFQHTDKDGKAVTKWKLVASGRANHIFDCEVMARVQAEHCQLIHLDPETQPKPEPPEPESPRESRSSGRTIGSLLAEKIQEKMDPYGIGTGRPQFYD